MPESNLSSISAGQILYSERGVSIRFHEGAQEVIMEMKGDKSHVTDHWLKQKQNYATVHFGVCCFGQKSVEIGTVSPSDF